MMKLVVFVFLVAVAVAAAQYIVPGVISRGAYGYHNPYAISSSARAQISRSGIIGIAPGYAYI